MEFRSSVVFVDGTESDINILPITTKILSIYAQLSHHFHSPRHEGKLSKLMTETSSGILKFMPYECKCINIGYLVWRTLIFYWCPLNIWKENFASQYRTYLLNIGTWGPLVNRFLQLFTRLDYIIKSLKHKRLYICTWKYAYTMNIHNAHTHTQCTYTFFIGFNLYMSS